MFRLVGVTTGDYIAGMKAMKERKGSGRSVRLTDGDDIVDSAVIRETVMEPTLGRTISVRAAKAHLSALLDLVSRGQSVVVTSGGKPKVRIVPMDQKPPRKLWSGSAEHYKKIPWQGGPDATQLIREDRDARGW